MGSGEGSVWKVLAVQTRGSMFHSLESCGGGGGGWGGESHALWHVPVIPAQERPR